VKNPKPPRGRNARPGTPAGQRGLDIREFPRRGERKQKNQTRPPRKDSLFGRNVKIWKAKRQASSKRTGEALGGGAKWGKKITTKNVKGAPKASQFLGSTLPTLTKTLFRFRPRKGAGGKKKNRVSTKKIKKMSSGVACPKGKRKGATETIPGRKEGSTVTKGRKKS